DGGPVPGAVDRRQAVLGQLHLQDIVPPPRNPHARRLLRQNPSAFLELFARATKTTGPGQRIRSACLVEQRAAQRRQGSASLLLRQLSYFVGPTFPPVLKMQAMVSRGHPRLPSSTRFAGCLRAKQARTDHGMIRPEKVDVTTQNRPGLTQ